MSDSKGLYEWIDEQSTDYDKVIGALKTKLESCQQRINKAVKSEKTSWEGLIGLLEKTQEDISALWAYPSHMNSVMNSDSWQNVYNEGIGLLSEYYSSLSHDHALYQKMKSLNNSVDAKTWTH